MNSAYRAWWWKISLVLSGVAFATCFLAAKPAFARSGGESFTDLVTSADTIVVGTIDNGSDGSSRQSGSTSGPGELSIRVTTPLKGNIAPGATISFHDFDKRSIEMTSVRGEPQLLLLGSSIEKDPRSFDLLHVMLLRSDSHKASMVDLIRRYLVVDTAPQDQRADLHLDWTVRAVEDPETLPVGVFELVSGPYDRATRDDHTTGTIERYLPRLFAVLYTANTLTASHIWLAEFLNQFDSPSVEAWMLERLSLEMAHPTEVSTMLLSSLASSADWATGEWIASQATYGSDPVLDARMIEQFLTLYPSRTELPEAFDDYDDDFQQYTPEGSASSGSTDFESTDSDQATISTSDAT